MKFIAHTKDGKSYTNEDDTQSLKTHLLNVAKYAKKYADGFGAGEVAELIGLLHDAGKYQADFQSRIRGARIKVDHATFGAKVLIEHLNENERLPGWIHGMVVASHHSGLKDSGSGINIADDTYSSRINNYRGQEAPYHQEINPSFNVRPKKLNFTKHSIGFAFATYIKMLLSSLVDADWTDTQEYTTGLPRNAVSYSMEELEEKLRTAIPLNNGTKINTIRAEILESCLKKANGKQGLYTLTVPTGGGKTLSSLAFALKHAIKHGLKRVIYVIPYTSIIEQNADIIGNCIGREFVLEHHSNVEIDSDAENQEESSRLQWASENWDIPITLTTNVQFFESFFSNKPSKIRKLHNIAESVVIFDEAQALPREYLSASMYAISELVNNYKVTAILCSATQPTISKYKYNNLDITEIIDDPPELAKELKRVEYSIIGQKADQQIVDIISENTKVLCIVNSRKHAYTLYQMAKECCEGNIYHLSTLMCPRDRRHTIKSIREKLYTHENVVVISTSLIEAGVDIDFPVVMRSISGIDSIIQAGGRANREGKVESGQVIVFEPTSDEGKPPKAMLASISISNEVIQHLREEAFGLEGISMYFRLLYDASSASDLLDSKGIISEFEFQGNSLMLNFETAAKKFKLIDDSTKEVVINIDHTLDSEINQIRLGIFQKETFQKLQQYSVSIYESEYYKLLEDHALEMLKSGHAVLNNPSYYSAQTGLDLFSHNNKNAECNII